MKELITKLHEQLAAIEDFNPQRTTWDHKDDSRLHIAEDTLAVTLRNNAQALLNYVEKLEAVVDVGHAIAADATQGQYGGCFASSVDHILIVNLRQALSALKQQEKV